MRAKILDQQVKLYSSPEPNALSLATLTEGTEIEFGKTIKAGGKKWVEVIMPSGQKGYLPDATRVFPFRLATPLQNNVAVYNQPSAQSLVRQTLQRNTKIYLIGVTRAEDQDWVQVRDMNGVEGYISGRTRLRVVQQKSKALARKNMLSGAFWCIGGIIVTVATYGAASNGGGTYFVAWGAIAYGAIQFISGIYQYFTATS
jgi:hypothetical protein